MALDGKRIVVTGSASGIGAAVSALLRRRGATVVGFDRTERTDNVDEFHRVEHIRLAQQLPEVTYLHGDQRAERGVR